MRTDGSDLRVMRHALRLAARGLGQVAPNPAVGCVILAADGRIVGRGWTQPSGRPHAEIVALAQAGPAAKGATAYITLEPCAHHGKTPPCADALIVAEVARVVGAVVDPDPRVSGQGFARLRAAGITVTCGLLEEEARALNLGFFHRITKSRPMVALKIAASLDGYVADARGKSQWITSERARRHGHRLRADHDAILIGIGTALADDPMLNCRLPGLQHRSPLRIVLDSRLRLSPSSTLVRTARQSPVMVFTAAAGGGEALAEAGADIVRQDPRDLSGVLAVLAARGLTRVLAEGGPTLQTALLQQGLVDRIHLYRAPLLLSAGRKALDPFIATLEGATGLRLLSRESLDPDVLETYALDGGGGQGTS